MRARCPSRRSSALTFTQRNRRAGASCAGFCTMQPTASRAPSRKPPLPYLPLQQPHTPSTALTPLHFNTRNDCLHCEEAPAQRPRNRRKHHLFHSCRQKPRLSRTHSTLTPHVTPEMFHSRTRTVLSSSQTCALNYTKPNVNPTLKNVSTQTDVTQLPAKTAVRGPKSPTRGPPSLIRRLQSQTRCTVSAYRGVPSPTQVQPSPTRVPLSPTDVPLSPLRVSRSPTPVQLSPTRAPLSPNRVPLSPTRVPLSPNRVPLSPNRIPLSPTRVPLSPTRVPVSPTRVPLSPTQRLISQNRNPTLPTGVSMSHSTRCPKLKPRCTKSPIQCSKSPTVSHSPGSPNSRSYQFKQKQLCIAESRPLFSNDLIDIIGEAYDKRIKCLFTSPVRNAKSTSIMNLIECPVSNRKRTGHSKKPWR